MDKFILSPFYYIQMEFINSVAITLYVKYDKVRYGMISGGDSFIIAYKSQNYIDIISYLTLLVGYIYQNNSANIEINTDNEMSKEIERQFENGFYLDYPHFFRSEEFLTYMQKLE